MLPRRQFWWVLVRFCSVAEFGRFQEQTWHHPCTLLHCTRYEVKVKVGGGLSYSTHNPYSCHLAVALLLPCYYPCCTAGHPLQGQDESRRRGPDREAGGARRQVGARAQPRWVLGAVQRWGGGL